MPSKRDKALIGAAGAVGAGLLSWQTMFPWIKYDLKMIVNGRNMSKRLMQDFKHGRYLIRMFEESVEKHPDKPFIIFEDRVYTYGFMNDQVNKVANIAMKWGLEVGECVAIMIQNEPSFIWTFLGLQKLGIAVAFINYNIKGKPLIHTLKACEARILIVGEGEGILQNVEEVMDDLDSMPVYVQGDQLMLGTRYISWDNLMLSALPVPVCPSIREGINFNTPCCYIFTSGTTGLPKPAIITQRKALALSKFFQLFGVKSDDIVYTMTPLYHTVAGGTGLMSVLDQGATMVLRRKFSAHHYFEDVRKHNCTVIQYIGELCRYLLAVPESPLDGQHKVRVAIGNGLRADIWEKFKNRYKIPNICEFYGATEGTAAFMNLSNRTGAVGRYSPFMRKLDPTPKLLVKYNTDTGEAVRDKNGLCLQVKVGEVGLLLGVVPGLYKNLQFYKGGKEINEQKILRDVLVKGDLYFNFGDLLAMDKDYFLYFKDRIGDTFRWKGENIATNEVANILTQLDFIHDANVYGVEVPGSEGRAGMAALHLEGNIPLTGQILKQIYDHCKDTLPSYSRPLFLRFPKEAATTVTFKQLKTHFRKDGFHPDKIDDPLYYYDDNKQTYSPLTVQNYPTFMAKSRL